MVPTTSLWSETELSSNAQTPHTLAEEAHAFQRDKKTNSGWHSLEDRQPVCVGWGRGEKASPMHPGVVGVQVILEGLGTALLCTPWPGLLKDPAFCSSRNCLDRVAYESCAPDLVPTMWATQGPVHRGQ